MSLAEAVTRGHRVSVLAEVLINGAVRHTLKVVGGSVDIDRSATYRRRCALTVVDPDGSLTATSSYQDPLSPFGNEIRISRGIPGDMEPLGVFRITGIRRTLPGNTVEVRGMDRSRQIGLNRFTRPYHIFSGTNYATAIQSLVTSRYPAATFAFISTVHVTPALTILEDDNPWEKAQEMAGSIGAEVLFDGAGTCVLRPQTDATTTAVFRTFEEGVDSTLITAESDLNDEPGWNGFIVNGEPQDAAPVFSEAWDDDPMSDTYRGRYGERAQFLRSQYIYTQAQADDAARTGLLRVKGGTRLLQFETLPDPRLRDGHTIRLVVPRLNISGVFEVEAVSHPLNVDGLSSVIVRSQ